MGSIASYIAQSALVMTMLYLTYKWLMASTTFHKLNRLVLMGIYAISWLLPFLLPFFIGNSTGTVPLISISLDAMPLETADTPALHPVDWWRIAVGIWLTGVAVTTCLSIAGMIRMWHLIHKGVCTGKGSYVLVVTDSAPGPFSWGKYIILRPEDCDMDMQMVVAHEEAHLRRLHWLDLLVAQVTVVLQWFSPAAWLMMRELKSVHEFQVDREVAGDDPAAYQMMLLKKTVGSSFPTFTDSLNHSQIKLRITMMMSKRTRPSRLVTALALPAVAALAVVTLSQPAVADVIQSIDRVTLSDGGYSEPKVTKSSPTTQDPPFNPNEVVVIEEAASTDSPVQTQTESTIDNSVETKNEDSSGEPQEAPAIFIDGNEFTGDLSSVNPKDIVSMQVVKNDPKYPQGKIMITTVNAADSSDRPVLTAEKIAEYKGGTDGLMRFLCENIKYPAEAHKAGIAGRVVVSFTVGTDGSVSDIKVLRGINDLLDNEAIRVVQLTSGQWIPAYNGGKPVASRFNLPITFSLTSK